MAQPIQCVPAGFDSDGYASESAITITTGPGSVALSGPIAAVGRAEPKDSCAGSLQIGFQINGDGVPSSIIQNVTTVGVMNSAANFTTLIAFVYTTPEGLFIQPLLNPSITGGLPFVQVGAAQLIPSLYLIPNTAGMTITTPSAVSKGINGWAASVGASAGIASAASYLPSPYNSTVNATLSSTKITTFVCFTTTGSA